LEKEVMKSNVRWVSVLAVATIAGAAQASPVLEFTEHNLGGNYNGSTSFTASGFGSSFAEVTRFLPSTSTATFTTPPGMSATGGGGMGGFSLSLSVLGSGSTRTGTGTFTCYDVSGADRITGTISGTWSYFSGTDQIHFDGALSGVTYTGTTFTGNSGSFSLLGLPTPGSGALVSLTTAGTGGFFNTAFQSATTGVDGQVLVVPLPTAVWAGGAMLLGVVTSRRLRRA
jgi:hypothetical protein